MASSSSSSVLSASPLPSSSLPLPLPPVSLGRRWLNWLRASIDADYYPSGATSVREQAPAFEWGRLLPFVFLHVGCLGVLWVGFSPAAFWVAFALYWVRMFAITGFYHRYFSHRTFETNRFWQAIFAVWGGMSMQKGALWWAANHRHHHRHSDDTTDLHSPLQRGFWWSHLGWLTSSNVMPTDYKHIKDFARYPELVWLNRFDWVPPLGLMVALWALGLLLPGTNPIQLLVWGFFVSTTVLFHGTSCINSLAHVWGTRRYATKDTSRNNFWLACITLGEGWHNNHHRFPGTVRQGFFWWEIDVTYYVLRAMEWLGVVRNLRSIPPQAYAQASTK